MKDLLVRPGNRELLRKFLLDQFFLSLQPIQRAYWAI